MSKKPFEKFINKAESGAKKKERIRQEKKQLRAEKNAFFEEKKRLSRERKSGGGGLVAGRKLQGTGSREKVAGSRKQVAGYRLQVAGSRGKVAGDRLQVAGLRGQGSGSGEGEKRSVGRSPGRQNAGHKPDVKKEIVRKSDSARRNNTGPSKIISKKTAQQTRQPITGKPSSAGSDPAKNEIPLNKFIAWSGVCGRREAAEIIKSGKVTVNNQVVTAPPFRVSQADSIRVNGKKISIQKNLVYILLNKPKDYITTLDDPEGRKTVMDLVRQATTERIFPVGRLDRNTTGVLLLTNDGELAQRLTHPKYEVKKIYEVRLDKPVTKQQLDKIAGGITLEDGYIRPDAIAYADAKDKSIVGIEIHSGRNRIVRRIFEHSGFKVKHLDRVMYGIFTKKNIDRGKWRLLTEKEIRLLKHLNTSFGHKKTS